MSEWQPIESAPKDGTLILAWGCWAGEINGPDDDPELAIVCWDGQRGDYPGFDWMVTGTDAHAAWLKPTHWQPLPDAPTLNPTSSKNSMSGGRV